MSTMLTCLCSLDREQDRRFFGSAHIPLVFWEEAEPDCNSEKKMGHFEV